jgi:hypothetical protein
VAGYVPAAGIEVTGSDPAWPRLYDDLAAKPIIDIDLTELRTPPGQRGIAGHALELMHTAREHLRA